MGLLDSVAYFKLRTKILDLESSTQHSIGVPSLLYSYFWALIHLFIYKKSLTLRGDYENDIITTI